MAERLVYFGPLNNSKKEDLINKSLEKLKKTEGNKFYYLLPNGELLTKYRRDFIDEVKQTFEINLYTFDNIVKNILRYEDYININEAMKDMILKKVIRKLDDDGLIKYYKDFTTMIGFAQSLNGIIGEIKRSLVYPEEFLKRSPDTPYYKEIGLIYKEYESYLTDHNLIDREGSYFKAVEILKNSTSFFENLDFIIIDEFYDFRPIEIAILREVCKSDVNIYINIPFDIKSKPSNISETISILKDLGFKIEDIEKEKFNFFENMGMNLFNHDRPKLDYNNSIKLIKSPSIYLEFKRIFEEIKKFNKEGVKLNEIAIVLLSDDYKEILIDVAMEERVPTTLRKENPLIEIPLVKEFLNLIQAKIRNGNKQSMINRLKSNYFPIVDYELRNALELILRRLNFSNSKELINFMKSGKELNISIDYMEPVKTFNQSLVDELSRIQYKDSIENHNNTLLEIIDEYKIEEEIYNRYRKNKNYELFYRDISALEKLKETIESMNEISIVIDEVSIDDYYESLVKLFEDETIIEENENFGGVKILNPINSRGFIHEIVFITGLSQQYYPKLKENNFFINDENNLSLKNIGLELKNYNERLNNEAIKFATLLSSCSEKLYLSFSEGLEGENITSIFLDEILSILPGEKLKEKLDFIEIDLSYLIKDDIETITTKDELSKYLLLKHPKDLSDDSKKYYGIHNGIYENKFKDINEKIFSEYRRYEKDFNEYSGVLSQDLILKDIVEANKNRIYSNSYLENYGKCPYAFLLARLLKVEEMERTFEEYSSMDVGNIYHEVLRHYYHAYKDDIIKHVKEEKEFDTADTFETLKELTHNYAIEFGLNPIRKSDLLIIENTYDRLKRFIEEDIERISGNKEKLVPHSFEVEFGDKGDFEIEVKGEKIKLSGKIDRIDKLLNEDKYVIMDYKSSPYGIYGIEDIKKGLSLQLPIYVMSQIDKNVIAGLYGIMSTGDFKYTIGILEESKLLTKRNKGGLDSEGWISLMDGTKDNIRTFIHNINKGIFSVDPLECSEYCIYKDICRYERVLEVAD